MKSMTGFGSISYEDNNYSIKIDIVSVNSKKLDIFIRTSSLTMFLEPITRNIISSFVSRGTIKATIKVDIKHSGNSSTDIFNKKIKEAVSFIKLITKDPSVNNNIAVSDILNYPGLLDINEIENRSELEDIVSEKLKLVLKKFNSVRGSEGKDLAKDIKKRINLLEKYRKKIEKLSSTVVEEYRQKIKDKLNELLNKDFDKYRFDQEIIYFAERADITEEIIRLDSHLKNFKKILTSNEPCGKHFNFIIQEILREFNTIGSKSKNIKISELIISSKCEIEKIREQIQNIE